MRRRRFLELTGGWSAGAMLGCGGDPLPPVSDRPWGLPSAEQDRLLVAPQARPEAVVELFLMGGLCPWDTFYCVPEFGRPDDPVAPNTMWWTFQGGSESVPEFFEHCGGGDRSLLMPWRNDSAGHGVYLGPWLYPLRERPDILARTRLLVMRHPFEPHDAATPFALSGFPRGTPRMATTGAHVQRAMGSLYGSQRSTPWSYVLMSSNSEIEAQFDINAASSQGLHPASTRPLRLRLTEESDLPAQLARQTLDGWHEAVDEARAVYGRAAADRLIRGGDAPLLHARGLNELRQAQNALRFGGDLRGLLTAETLAPRYGSECLSESVLDDTAMGLELATHLVLDKERGPRYVLAVDGGLVDATGAGYDTHNWHVRDSSRNVVHTARTLSRLINEPGEGDPAKLDLDKHMVCLTTEFGRTPYTETGKPLGLDHWPFGYVVALIGGPVVEENAGIVGAIGPDGYATDYVTPTELRAALLSAQGIWPFSPEGFAVGDVRGATTEEEAARIVRSRVLGWG